jgi:hypothetical protein
MGKWANDATRGAAALTFVIKRYTRNNKPFRWSCRWSYSLHCTLGVDLYTHDTHTHCRTVHRPQTVRISSLLCGGVWSLCRCPGPRTPIPLPVPLVAHSPLRFSPRSPHFSAVYTTAVSSVLPARTSLSDLATGASRLAPRARSQNMQSCDHELPYVHTPPGPGTYTRQTKLPCRSCSGAPGVESCANAWPRICACEASGRVIASCPFAYSRHRFT